jgi:hypothetical protein
MTKEGVSIGKVARGYALPKWFAMRLFKVPPRSQGYDGYVHVVGTFRYFDLTPAPTPKPGRSPRYRDLMARIPPSASL